MGLFFVTSYKKIVDSTTQLYGDYPVCLIDNSLTHV